MGYSERAARPRAAALAGASSRFYCVASLWCCAATLGTVVHPLDCVTV